MGKFNIFRKLAPIFYQTIAASAQFGPGGFLLKAHVEPAFFDLNLRSPATADTTN